MIVTSIYSRLKTAKSDNPNDSFWVFVPDQDLLIVLKAITSSKISDLYVWNSGDINKIDTRYQLRCSYTDFKDIRNTGPGWRGEAFRKELAKLKQ